MNTCCVRPWTLGIVAFSAVTGAALAGFGVGYVARPTAPNTPLMIDASASAIGEDFSMATGQVSQEAEGVFVLDHTTGLLQCNVLYPRSGQFGASFQANVKEALPGGGKNSKFLMVTGTAQFPGGANRSAGNCVVYVLDTSTGGYVCYGIPFNESAVNSRAPQMGVMLPLATGMARQALDRDALR